MFPSSKLPKIIVICGPTAVGKSDLAVVIAKKFNGEIISADSRQVYKGLNVGSGKITKKEMRSVPHHLLDVVNLKKVFSVADYQKLAYKKIDEIISRGRLPIICGGTGFYIDSIVKGTILPEVPPNKVLRKRLGEKSTADLIKILKKLDMKRASEIDINNPIRLIRAIEIATALGKVPKEKSTIIYDSGIIGLDMRDDELKEKIKVRLEKRLNGIILEIKKLHEEKVSWKRLEGLGLEYRYGAQFCQNKISKQEMIEKINIDTWHYVKRQRTWFRGDKNIKWFDPNEIGKIEKEIKEFLR